MFETRSERQRPSRRLLRRPFASGSVAIASAAIVCSLAFRSFAASEPDHLSTNEKLSAQRLSAQKERGSGFPDFGFMVTPAEYAANYSDQPIFRLKTDFPHNLPAMLPAFLDQIDFRKDPLK